MKTKPAELIRHPWGWTSLAPIACALHCAATPLLVASAPSLAPGETAEWILLALTVLLGGAALAAAMRSHREALPFLLIGVGLLAWTGSLLHLYHPLPEELTTIAASLTVAGGLLWNSRLHCGFTGAPCETCSADAEAVPAAVTSHLRTDAAIEVR